MEKKGTGRKLCFLPVFLWASPSDSGGKRRAGGGCEAGNASGRLWFFVTLYGDKMVLRNLRGGAGGGRERYKAAFHGGVVPHPAVRGWVSLGA